MVLVERTHVGHHARSHVVVRLGLELQHGVNVDPLLLTGRPAPPQAPDEIVGETAQVVRDVFGRYEFKRIPVDFSGQVFVEIPTREIAHRLPVGKQRLVAGVMRESGHHSPPRPRVARPNLELRGTRGRLSPVRGAHFRPDGRQQAPMELATLAAAPSTVRIDTQEHLNVRNPTSIYVQCIPSIFLSQANKKKYFNYC